MTRTNWDRILKLCVNIFETDSWPLDINLGWKQFSLGKLFVCAKQSTLIGDTSIVNDFALCSRLDFRCRPDSLQRKLVYGWYRLVCFICGGFCYQISGKRDSAVCWTSSFKVYTVKKKLKSKEWRFWSRETNLLVRQTCLRMFCIQSSLWHWAWLFSGPFWTNFGPYWTSWTIMNLLNHTEWSILNQFWILLNGYFEII